MATKLPVCLFFQNGSRKSQGVYDFSGLSKAFSHVKTPPALIVLCEAKEWGYWGSDALYKATDVVSRHFNTPYQSEVAHLSRGDFGPAILFNPNLLAFSYWGDLHSSVPHDKRNLARLKIRESRKEFEVLPEHWDFTSGRARMPYAERISSYGDKKIPVLVAGDLNETASGLHLPQIDWQKASSKMRQHKGKKLPDGSYGPHTEAVDLLVGEWEERYPTWNAETQRINSAGFHMVAELAAATGTPAKEAFAPTTKDGLLIDMLLINREWLKQGGIVAKTYEVIGAGITNWPSDHYLVSATLRL